MATLCKHTGLITVDAATRGPRPQAQDTATGTSPTWPPASGSVVCTLYNTPPEDFSSCTLNQEDLFE